MLSTLTPDTFYDDVRNMVHMYDPNLPRKYHIQKHVHDVTLDELNCILEQDEDAFNYLLKEVRKCSKQQPDDILNRSHKQLMMYNHQELLKRLDRELTEDYINARCDWIEVDIENRRVFNFMKYRDWMRRYRYNQWCLITGRFTASKVALSRSRAYNKRSKKLTNKKYDNRTSRTTAFTKATTSRKCIQVSRSHEQRRGTKRCRPTKKCNRKINRKNQSRTCGGMPRSRKAYL